MDLQEKKKLLLGKGMKTEDKSEFTYAAAEAALADKKTFKFQGKTYPVKMSKDQAKEIVNESIVEEYLDESNDQLTSSIENSDFFKEGTIFTPRRTGGYELDKRYEYLNVRGWGNNIGAFAHPKYETRWGVPKGTPLFAAKEMKNAFNNILRGDSSKSRWIIEATKTPNKPKDGKTYAPELVSGNGVIFKLDSGDFFEESKKLAASLLANGFRKINFLGQSFVVAGYTGSAGSYHFGSDKNVSNNNRPAHPVYALHKENINGKTALFHADSYTDLQVAPNQGRDFPSESSKINLSGLSGKLLTKIPYGNDYFKYEIFGDKNPSALVSSNLTSLFGAANSHEASKTYSYSPGMVELFTYYGIIKKADTKPTSTQPTTPSGEDIGGFNPNVTGDVPSTSPVDDNKPDPVNIGKDLQDWNKNTTSFINNFNNLKWMTTQLKGILETSVAAIASIPLVGRYFVNPYAIPVAILLAVGIGGAFQFRKYLSRRSHRKAREVARDRKLVQELGFATKDLKASMTEKEQEDFIKSLEDSERKDPKTRRLYDL